MSRHSSYKKVGEVYKNPYVFENSSIKENFILDQPVILDKQQNTNKEDYIKKNETKDTIDVKYTANTYSNAADPEVWGPSFWFTLHNGAMKYPVKASPIWIERMKGFILGIPVMIPCEKCADHATSYIESNYKHLDEIVSGRDNLFKFFVDFHNKVNERYGKPIMSYENARKLYSGRARVLKMKYE
jgi:hypothetical protein